MISKIGLSFFLPRTTFDPPLFFFSVSYRAIFKMKKICKNKEKEKENENGLRRLCLFLRILDFSDLIIIATLEKKFVNFYTVQ